ncbi:MAG TPA: DUF748 domain-containing protein, partial [Candidatus Limnocylindria bacterium]|nr:DUF748 domain-containing protein [Candidatus Limnocylindria bacterium]
VGTVRVSDTQAHLFTPDGQHDVALALEVHDLAGDGEQPAATKLTLAMGDATVALEGGTRLAPPGFAGTLTVTDLPLADVTDIAAVLPPTVLQGGTLGASLRLAAGSAAEPAGDVTVAGTVGLERFTLVGDAPELFSVALGKLDVAIDELRLPGVLAPPDVARQPPIVKLATMALAGPSVRLTRTPEGLVLPDLAPPPRTDSESPPARSAAGVPETEPAPADAGAAPSADAASGAAPAPLDVTVGSLRVDDGVVRVSDRTVKPFFTGGFEALDLEVRALRYPALTMEHLELTAKSITRGSLRVTGKRTAAGGRLEVNGKDIALEPFNPYATHYSPYSISGGALSVTSKATIKGGAYDSTTALTLDRFDLGGKEGDSLFKQQFGIPLEVALALLRDLQGRIALDIPMAGDERGTKVSVMTVAAQALRAALVNALASPLKLVGAAFGGAGGQAAPAPIAFATGRAVPTGDGEKAIAALGGLLASRPGIGITLLAAPTEADARWLAEQALREELSQPQGVFGAIGNLAQRGVRERIRLALEARAEGKEGALEGDDAATLEEWLAERPAPSASQLRALAAARIERVATELREQHGVGPERVAQAEPASEARPGDAVVTFELGAARSRGAS